MNSAIINCPSCGKKNRIPADRQHLGPKCGHCSGAIDLQGHGFPVKLDDGSFHDFIKNASLPVLVDFFSPTCGPCRMMMPIIESMARKHVNRFIIATLDTGKNQQTAFFFDIRGVPSFLFFKDGILANRLSGATDENTLEQQLESL